MARKILNPRWGNVEKTQIRCKFEYEDGRVQEVSIVNVDGSNPDWTEVLQQFPEEEITRLTEEKLAKEKEQRQAQIDAENERRERFETEMLFNHKIKLFEIEEVQNSKNRSLKSKIRKAKNIESATVYASVLVMQELALAAETETTE